jgi:hypothetical protein
MTSGRAASFDNLQKPCEYRVEVSWRFPERGVSHPTQAMTAAFPQIGICDGIEVIEIDETIRATVHHSERYRTAFHDQSLIHTFSGVGCLEKPFAKAAICARDAPRGCELQLPSLR